MKNMDAEQLDAAEAGSLAPGHNGCGGGKERDADEVGGDERERHPRGRTDLREALGGCLNAPRQTPPAGCRR